MRHPAGGILDLQAQDKRGSLQKPEVRAENILLSQGSLYVLRSLLGQLYVV